MEDEWIRGEEQEENCKDERAVERGEEDDCFGEEQLQRSRHCPEQYSGQRSGVELRRRNVGLAVFRTPPLASLELDEIWVVGFGKTCQTDQGYRAEDHHDPEGPTPAGWRNKRKQCGSKDYAYACNLVGISIKGDGNLLEEHDLPQCTRQSLFRALQGR